MWRDAVVFTAAGEEEWFRAFLLEGGFGEGVEEGDDLVVVWEVIEDLLGG